MINYCKERINEKKDAAEESLTDNQYIRMTYKGLMLLKKVVTTYLDLTADFILLSTVMVVLGINSLTLENFQN